MKKGPVGVDGGGEKEKQVHEGRKTKKQAGQKRHIGSNSNLPCLCVFLAIYIKTMTGKMIETSMPSPIFFSLKGNITVVLSSDMGSEN